MVVISLLAAKQKSHNCSLFSPATSSQKTTEMQKLTSKKLKAVEFELLQLFALRFSLFSYPLRIWIKLAK